MSSEVTDIYEQDLQEKKVILQACQKMLRTLQHSDCEKMFECETRKTYVKAVYESMAKGQGGGFEF